MIYYQNIPFMHSFYFKILFLSQIIQLLCKMIFYLLILLLCILQNSDSKCSISFCIGISCKSWKFCGDLNDVYNTPTHTSAHKSYINHIQCQWMFNKS